MSTLKIIFHEKKILFPSEMAQRVHEDGLLDAAAKLQHSSHFL
jgi:hypothetical protein